VHTLKQIAASIEVSPKQAVESKDLPGLFPEGTSVYLTDIGTEPLDTMIGAAKRLRDLGYEPVPHFAARRMPSRELLETRIKRSASEAGVKDVLIIGGGVPKPLGEFTSAMDLINSRLFEKYGINRIAVAGHPEGSPDFNDAVAQEALQQKQLYADTSGTELRLLTQFGFAPDKFINWSETLKQQGITLPVHIGVAGPAKVTTLIKYAALCGVGNSIAYLRKNALSLTALATRHSPEGVVKPIEDFWLNNPDSAIRQMHVFPFGGLVNSAQWLRERGTWPPSLSPTQGAATL
jgi:methylenetetrahydrofolate reductase (NADPH)